MLDARRLEKRRSLRSHFVVVDVDVVVVVYFVLCIIQHENTRRPPKGVLANSARQRKESRHWPIVFYCKLVLRGVLIFPPPFEGGVF